MLSHPDCLLLDEPTNYLDILSLRFLTRFLQRWDKELILVTHDREFMDNVTTHILGIHRQEIKKIKGPTSDYFSFVLQQEEAYEKTRLNQEKKKASLQLFIDRMGAKASKASQAQARKKALEKMPDLTALTFLDDLNFSFTESPFTGKKMLDVASISFAYSQDRPIIHNLSFEVAPHSRIAIIGKNGNGKSTLLALLAREHHPNAGTIVFSEHVHTGYFGQTNIKRLSEDKTIEQKLSLLILYYSIVM